MEEDLKISKLNISAITGWIFLKFKLKPRKQNLNKKCYKWKQPPMQDDLKMLKVDSLSNRWSDLPQTLKWSPRNQSKINNAKWKTTWKSWISQKLLIGPFLNFNLDFSVLRGKLLENSKEILNVALLSPACFYFFGWVSFLPKSCLWRLIKEKYVLMPKD